MKQEQNEEEENEARTEWIFTWNENYLQSLKSEKLWIL